VPPGGGHGMGGRIADARKLRCMTQAQLAEGAAISLSLLRKIEQGSRPVTAGVWSSVARALGLTTATAVEQARSADSRVSAAIPHIRCALDCYDLPDDGPIAPLIDMSAAAEKATTRRLAADYASLAYTLPGLISELTRAAHGYNGRDQEIAFGLLALACGIGHHVPMPPTVERLSVPPACGYTRSRQRPRWGLQSCPPRSRRVAATTHGAR
jgi:transcriptional regulator with XRE-family HTH domain